MRTASAMPLLSAIGSGAAGRAAIVRTARGSMIVTRVGREQGRIGASEAAESEVGADRSRRSAGSERAASDRSMTAGPSGGAGCALARAGRGAVALPDQDRQRSAGPNFSGHHWQKFRIAKKAGRRRAVIRAR
jgi:hypothetical protein